MHKSMGTVGLVLTLALGALALGSASSSAQLAVAGKAATAEHADGQGLVQDVRHRWRGHRHVAHRHWGHRNYAFRHSHRRHFRNYPYYGSYYQPYYGSYYRPYYGSYYQPYYYPYRRHWRPGFSIYLRF